VSSAETASRATPAGSRSSCHGLRSRYAVTLKSAGIRKSHARDAERLAGLRALLAAVVADHVPDAVQLEQAVGVDGALGGGVAARRPVGEADRALLADGLLQLGQPLRDLGRVDAAEQVDGGRLGAGIGRVGAAQRQVLQRQAQRLGVCELALEQVEAGLQRRQLGVGEVDRRQEVVLLAEVVQLLAGELVAAGRDRHSQALQLGTIGVVAAGERLVAHVRVALDVVLHVAGCDRSLFRHQVGDERKLADELVGVVRQSRD
jgi:hypothetical protein